MANDLPPPPPPPPPPPLSPPPGLPEAAYVEEYNEEAETTRPETRQTANITAKRSKPEIANAKVARDEFSDSGYSSHTAATLGSSATSSLESKAGSNPPKVEENTVASKRRPTGVEKIVKRRSHSPEKPSLRRTSSKAEREKHAQSKQPCGCTQCIAKARQASTPIEPSSQHDAKVKAKSRPKLTFLRTTKPPQAQVVPNTPILQPAQPQARPRALTSQSYHRPRPISFHAGSVPDQVYMQQPFIVERQPSHPTTSPYPPPSSYPPPQQSYFPPPPVVPPPRDFYTPLPSPYTTQLPPRPRGWSSGQHHPPRPQSMYYNTSPPIIEHGEDSIYTTIAPGIRPVSRQPSHRQRPTVSSEETPIRPEDYYKMPPPPPRVNTQPRQESRPKVHHAYTTSDAHPSLHHRRSGREESVKAHVGNRSPVKQSFADHERSRRPEAKFAKRSDESVPSIHAIGRGMARMNAESNTAKHERRASTYGHETLQDLEGSIEAYQNSQGTPMATTALPVDSLVRRKKTHAGSSDTSSRHSGKSGKSKTSREGSDVKSRRPSSEIKPRNDTDGLAMRFNAAQGVNLDLKSGIEGRTISLRQSRDGEGEMELSIGSRGRVVGSRPPMPSREKSKRRTYSYIDGQGMTELERSKATSRAPRGSSYDDEKGVTTLERTNTASRVPQEIREGDLPRIIRETITTTSRSRRSSRSGYSGRGQAEQR